MKQYFGEEGIFRLPNDLTDFQKDMYIHLIKWKWKNITEEAGIYKNEEYDAILPKALADKYVILYPDIRDKFIEHHKRFPFRIHKHFNHMASSQVANINLFLPVLHNPEVDKILSRINPNFKSLANDQLDNGYRIEFWDEPYGNLNDKSPVAGTDSDIAIAYYNHNNELCLWLIEHKLTEKEFTHCGGNSSKGKKERNICNACFIDILKNKSLCYYHDVKKFKYWDITERNQDFFKNHVHYDTCPFDKGMNQLWRNQLLALSIEQDERQPYTHVHFSVVRHPHNDSLDSTMHEYIDLINNNEKFSFYTSEHIVRLAEQTKDPQLVKWTKWYRELYNLDGKIQELPFMLYFKSEK